MARSELYQFKHGDKQWFFTSARKAITHNIITYFPVRGLSRGDIEDADIDKCDIDITFPQPHLLVNEDGQDLAQIFINKIYYQGVKIEIFELEDGIPLILFKGRVVLPKFDENDDTMTLACSTAESQFKRTIFTRKFQRTCPNAIYDIFCGLKIEDWAFRVRITGVRGTAFNYEILPTQVLDSEGNSMFEQVPLLDENNEPVLDENNELVMVDGDPIMEVKEYLADYLDNGLLIKDAVHTYLRTSGLMYRPHYGLKIGDEVLLAPGCDQTRRMCIDKFDNGNRFCGHINIPNENPHDSFILK